LLHDCCSDRAGQAAPPFDAGVVMLRVRLWLPPPHDLLHEPHADQPETAQLTLGGDVATTGGQPKSHAQHHHARVERRRGLPGPV